MNVKIFKSPEEIAEEVSLQLYEAINKIDAVNQNYFLAVSGGSTPIYLFERLSRSPYKEKINWSALQIFWVDERCVPPDDAESNYRMTKKYLLDKISIPERNIHRIFGENNPSKEIKRYSLEIKKNVPIKNALPAFDLILLGIGSDGHTASLFPNKELIEIADQICGTAKHPDTGQNRISLTEEVLNNGERILFLVSGKEKAGIVEKILNKKVDVSNLPAAKIKPHSGDMFWYIDKEAAGTIEQEIIY